MNSSFARWGLIYPVHFLRGEITALSHRDRISTLDTISREELFEWQESELLHLLQHVHNNEPYYKLLLDPFVHEGQIPKPLSFFSQLPFLTKEHIQQAEKERYHPFFSGLDHRTTSGSTGTPFGFWKDHFATGYMQAIQDHAYGWHNIQIGAPQARFWGLPTGRGQIIAKIKDRLKNRIRFSAFHLTKQDMHAFYKRLVAFKPQYLYGYPSLLLEFARFVAQERLPLTTVPLRVVIGTGEYVPQHIREELQMLFNAPFASEYGCSETGVIGFECPAGRLHLMAANILLEIVDAEGNQVPEGEEGEVIITELNAHYFPFIRYRIGDRARYTGEQCPCGRTLPVFEVLAGRRDAYILTPEGRKVYDAILAYILKKEIVQFKAVQEHIERLRIYIRPGKGFTPELEQQYIDQLQQAISPLVHIDFVKVEEIEREPSGKMRYFRSEIMRDEDE